MERVGSDLNCAGSLCLKVLHCNQFQSLTLTTLYVMDCDQSKIMVESGDMITIHPVLQYYDVIARDMLVIGAIV